jgi:hypothetical protein
MHNQDGAPLAHSEVVESDIRLDHPEIRIARLGRRLEWRAQILPGAHHPRLVERTEIRPPDSDVAGGSEKNKNRQH